MPTNYCIYSIYDLIFAILSCSLPHMDRIKLLRCDKLQECCIFVIDVLRRGKLSDVVF
jgi:hypothetical protein